MYMKIKRNKKKEIPMYKNQNNLIKASEELTNHTEFRSKLRIAEKYSQQIL